MFQFKKTSSSSRRVYWRAMRKYAIALMVLAFFPLFTDFFAQDTLNTHAQIEKLLEDLHDQRYLTSRISFIANMTLVETNAEKRNEYIQHYSSLVDEFANRQEK